MYRAIDCLTVMKNTILMGFESSDLQLFRFDSDLQELVHLKTEDQLEHDKTITGMDVFTKMNLFVTGSLDGYVKVWN